ncbi:hypothetical protein ABZ366_29070, partial [Streptomyces sp. NPDC005904]|uniref:hypothetical protein n=1 Tax=Streptomyces sp. NPDC005904 TaxID=3154570 RepID=UPI0033D6DEFC
MAVHAVRHEEQPTPYEARLRAEAERLAGAGARLLEQAALLEGRPFAVPRLPVVLWCVAATGNQAQVPPTGMTGSS